MANFYELLGVQRDASQNEIRSAYRKLARKYHPDVSQSPEAAKVFAQISEAYRVLSNNELRALYDNGEITSASIRTRDQRAQRAAYRDRINRVVEEMIEEERAEATARGQAVIVVVTLFASTFIVALSKPSILDSVGIFWKVIAVVLFVFAVRFLYQSFNKMLEKYTYRPDFPSVTRLAEPPKQPFSRRAAFTFLLCGYAISLTVGTIMGYWASGWGKEPYFDNIYLFNILLLPPISVFLIHLWRFIFNKLDEITKL